MTGKCKQCGGRIISQTNLFYVDVVMRICADCGYVQSAYRKRANTASTPTAGMRRKNKRSKSSASSRKEKHERKIRKRNHI